MQHRGQRNPFSCSAKGNSLMPSIRCVEGLMSLHFTRESLDAAQGRMDLAAWRHATLRGAPPALGLAGYGRDHAGGNSMWAPSTASSCQRTGQERLTAAEGVCPGWRLRDVYLLNTDCC